MGQLNTNYNSNVNVNNPIDEGLTFHTNSSGKTKMVVPMYETSLLVSGMFVGLLLGVSVAAIFKKGSNSPQPVYLVKE
ncbi:MAG: hypothetical protein ACW972_07245 [Promethearchaeota archaeon]|jgi:hypothetical protein